MDEISKQTRFRLTSKAPGRARHWADEVIDLDPDGHAIVMLLLSELVTNSVRHCGCPPYEDVVVAVRRAGSSVHVDVSDPGPGERIEPSDSLEHAGLRIVDALADRWGVRHHPTTVWFDVVRRITDPR